MWLSDDGEVLRSILDVEARDLQRPVSGYQVEVVDIDDFDVVDVIAALGGHPGPGPGHGIGGDVVIRGCRCTGERDRGVVECVGDGGFVTERQINKDRGARCLGCRGNDVARGISDRVPQLPRVKRVAVGIDQHEVEVIDESCRGKRGLQCGCHVVPGQRNPHIVSGGDHVAVDGELVFDNFKMLQAVLHHSVGHRHTVFVSCIQHDVDGHRGVNKSPAGGVVGSRRGRHSTGSIGHATVVGRVRIAVDFGEGSVADIIIDDVGGRLDGQCPQG